MANGRWRGFPDVISPGTPEEGRSASTFTLVSKGENYPTVVGAGGGCGLLYSRFKERQPEFWHKAYMLARGAIGLGIQRFRNKVKQSLDFATTTWDQAARLACYERDRLLGVDQMPYVTPPNVKFRTSLFARDASGNLACAIQPGDVVTLDSTVDFQYTGAYEVLDGLTVIPPTAQAKSGGGEIALTASENSGEIELSLGPYNPAIMYDTSDPTQAGWPDVPGSDPGNSTNFTIIPLTAGQFSFFTGVGSSGTAFQLPSTGFPAGNVLAWAGPGGFLHTTNVMETIALCAVSSSLGLTLKYEDGSGNFWIGDVNFACLTWLSADVPSSSGGLSWVVLTLLGGEIVAFGQGVVAGDGSFTVTLPAGFSTDKMYAVAFPHDGEPTTNHAHWVGAYVDSSQVAHGNFKDGEGNVWHCNVAVLIFAWKNNMSTITTETLSGGNWMQCTLPTGQIFGAGSILGVADGTTVELPSSAGDGSTLEVMVGTSGWDYPDNGTPASGVKDCYLDASNVVHIDFGNTIGSVVWPGAADIFGLYCTSGSSVPTVVHLTPGSLNMSCGTVARFAAKVLNQANQNVSWSVDGIAGGNVTVGTVDSNGNYASPDVAGTHTITATSVADPTASGSAAVTVFGTLIPPPGAVLTDDRGDIVYVNGVPIYISE